MRCYMNDSALPLSVWRLSIVRRQSSVVANVFREGQSDHFQGKNNISIHAIE